ncbi:MAG: hypothetical protein ALMCE001_07020 [Methanocorpusculum sp. MCE]|nr:MAG: hypothetical protein ALMCE001_07020 [Methanocorpusculum sp. MCE]
MRKHIYINVTDEEFHTLDSIAENLGFISRTELFTACAHLLLYGETAGKIPDGITADQLTRLHHYSEDVNCMQRTFMEIVRETALPVIAMKGIATAENAFGEDIKHLIYERCGMVPEDTDIRTWFRVFKNLHRAELLEYRSRQFAAALAGDGE